MAGMLLSKISPRQLQSKPAPSDNQNQTPEFIKYDLARQRLDAEFREKIAKKAAPNTFPKPVVTPRRSSLQFSRDHFRGFSPSSSENTEPARSSRKSVGDIFGERRPAKNYDLGQAQVRAVSGDHRPMLRSQTWVEVGRAIVVYLVQSTAICLRTKPGTKEVRRRRMLVLATENLSKRSKQRLVWKVGGFTVTVIPFIT